MDAKAIDQRRQNRDIYSRLEAVQQIDKFKSSLHDNNGYNKEQSQDHFKPFAAKSLFVISTRAASEIAVTISDNIVHQIVTMR